PGGRLARSQHPDGRRNRVDSISGAGAALAHARRMRWPKLSIQNVRPSRFHPPFCPWRDCKSHNGARARFHAHGSYRTKASSGRIPRFRCTCCEHTCSRQTFSTTYYLKKPHLLVAVASQLAACSAHRQIARSERCAKTSLTRIAERLGRPPIPV